MWLNFNHLSLFLFLIGLLSIILAYLIRKKGGKALRWFSYMMLSNALWAITYGIELDQTELEKILYIIYVEYLGIASIPIFWLLFCIHFSDKEHYLKPYWTKFLLYGMPLITVLIVWTNDYHHLHYKSVELKQVADFYFINIERGPWYEFFTFYFYGLLGFGCYLLYIKIRSADKIYRKQNISIIIAALIPWFANMAYLSGLRPYQYLDLSPFAFFVTCVLIFISIYQFKLFNIIPIAKDKILEIISDGYLVINQNLILVDYNKAAIPYLPKESSNKWIGLPITDLFSKQAQLISHIQQQIPGKLPLICTSQEEAQYLEADLLFLNENKIYTDFCLIKIANLTEQKKESERIIAQSNELQRLNKLKDSIFSIIAHDLRGPFVNLSEVLKMVANGDISTEEFKALAPSLSRDIIYTTDLLENILHWSRSQLSGFGIKKELFNLRNLVIDEIHYHSPAAALKHIKIFHDIFPNSMVYADMIMIQIVVRNLLNNAIKFCHQGGEIQINSFFDGKNSMIMNIKDNGKGMSQAQLDKLFQQENFSSRGTSNEKGTGLGLMICKEFLERNGGALQVHSMLGNGSTFTLIIPVSEQN